MHTLLLCVTSTSRVEIVRLVVAPVEVVNIGTISVLIVTFILHIIHINPDLVDTDYKYCFLVENEVIDLGMKLVQSVSLAGTVIKWYTSHIT